MNDHGVFRPLTDLQIDYQAELNPQQYAAVTAPPGPALVLAGAGSGKTRTLTYRVAFLLEQGIPPERILLLTFTNKAAREMMHRVSSLLGREVRELWGGTFHAVGARVLRAYGETVGCGPSFTILDRADSEDLLGACVADLGIDRKSKEFPKIEAIGDIFSQAANRRMPLAGWLDKLGVGTEELAKSLDAIHKTYAERKRAGQCFDFDDLLLLWLELMIRDEAVRALLQKRFQFVLVDEYQDTNKLQSELIDLLGAGSRNVMVVGDDSQSIYSWRGAEFRNIIDFPKRYPGAAVYKIEVNYRSTPEILHVANAAIASNTEQFPKTLEAASSSGDKPVLVECYNARQQAAFVARRIEDFVSEGVPPSQIAVLYRSHFHALELQMELSRSRIPHVITSGIRFFEQAHVKDAVAFLKLMMNPADEVSFRRIARMLPGIGERSAQKLWTAFQKRHAKGTPGSKLRLAAAFQGCLEDAPAKARKDWANWAITLGQCAEETSPERILFILTEGGYEDYLKLAYDSVERRLEDLAQMQQMAQEFADLPTFLTQLALYTDLESEQAKARADAENSVRLSTVHQAKGLEFDAVFVIHLSETLFPSRRSSESDSGIEEERRLFYVAITRARKYLTLTYPTSRKSATSGWEESLLPSRFLSEIAPELVDAWNSDTASW